MQGDSLAILAQGIALGTALCCTLGPQSIFVLRQGMRGEAALGAATICTLGDAAMILTGAAGFGLFLANFPSLTRTANWASAAFVMLYGSKMVLETLGPRQIDDNGAKTAARRRAGATVTALVLTLLNPQVYLEMIGLVGSISMRFAATERALFALGVMLVSPLWFYGLALGGKRLATLIDRWRALRTVDLVTGSVMVGIGAVMIVADIAPVAP